MSSSSCVNNQQYNFCYCVQNVWPVLYYTYSKISELVKQAMHASIKFLSVCATISFTPHCRGFVCKLAPTLLSPLRNHVSSFFSTNVATRINMENFVPSLPSPCLNDIGRALQEKMKTDLTAMEQDIQSEEGQRDAFFKLVSYPSPPTHRPQAHLIWHSLL